MGLHRPFAYLIDIMGIMLLSWGWMGCSRSGIATGKDASGSGGSGGGPDASPLFDSGGTTGGGGTAGTGSMVERAGGATVGTGGRVGGDGGTTLLGTQATGGLGSGGASGSKAQGGATGQGGAMPSGGTMRSGGTFGTGGATSKDGGLDLPTGGHATGGNTGAGGSTVCAPPAVSLTGANAVANGPLVIFNDNGSWSWFQDERAVVDRKGSRLVVGSVAYGGSRNGNVEAVVYDLDTRSSSGPARLGNLLADDHDAPAFIVRPDGRYVAVWAGHYQDCNSYFSVYDGTSWSAQQTYDWTPQGCPWSRTVSYSNLWYLGTNLVNFVRSVDTSPNCLVSQDDGASWSYGGRLTSTPTVGYVAGYYKYWGNNTDRIDFAGTEAHPRDNNNSLYHGYVMDGKLFDSTGTVVDAVLADDKAKDITYFTRLFATGSKVGNVAVSNAWVCDLVRYDDGTLGLIWTGRVGSTANNQSNPDLRLLYGRFDGTSWKLTYLVKAGAKLYDSEQDYTGLGALDPDDPTTIYVSTPYDPRSDSNGSSSKHEIWRGTTCDNGATFQWTPVTASSSKDNLRPIVPKWDAQHTALLWMQGTYRSASTLSTSIVGTITVP